VTRTILSLRRACRAVPGLLAVLPVLLIAGEPAAPARGAAAPQTHAAASGPATAQPGARTFAFDATGSKLGFTVTRPGEVVEGTATQFEGTVRLDPEHPNEGGGVTLKVDAATMVTGNRLRDRTMRNSHLETETYPEIRFESVKATTAKAEPLKPGETRGFEVEGKLSLHGVERTLKIPVMVGYDGALLTADGTAAFTLTEFSIPIPKFLWFVLDDKVTVNFHAVARPGPPGTARPSGR
jgi:polyisoprenoid-binding protein YceI